MRRQRRIAADGIAAVALVAVFVLVTVGVQISSTVTAWDRSVASWIVDGRWSVLTVVLWVATVAGDRGTMTVLTVLAGLAFLAWGRWRSASVFLFAVASGQLLVEGVKQYAQRVRPPAIGALVATPSSYSFPSGHAFTGLVFFGLASLLIATHLRRRSYRTAAVSVGMLLGLTVGFSRVYLGVHWPSDTLASWALASAWILLWRALYARLRLQAWDVPRAPVELAWAMSALLAVASVAALVAGARADPLLW